MESWAEKLYESSYSMIAELGANFDRNFSLPVECLTLNFGMKTIKKIKSFMPKKGQEILQKFLPLFKFESLYIFFDLRFGFYAKFPPKKYIHS